MKHSFHVDAPCQFEKHNSNQYSHAIYSIQEVQDKHINPFSHYMYVRK